MRAVVLTAHGGPEVLQVRDLPDPPLGAGQVRIAVAAAGVNFADTMARIGLYKPAPKPPSVVGYEVAGTVAEVAPGVSSVAVGDRVFAATRFGGYAEQVVVGADDLIPIPGHLSFAEAAAIPVNYATASAALFRYGAAEPGERVLVHAAAGGVGIAALQLGTAAGLEVHGTASAGKHDAVRAHGATEVYDYNADGWDRDLSGSFDLVMDAVGGASFARSLKLLRAGGRLVAYGASSVNQGEKRDLLRAVPQVLRMLVAFNVMELMESSRSVIGLNMLELWDAKGTLTPFIEPLSPQIADGTIKPVVAAQIPFADAPEAHRMLAQRRNVGKVVLVP